MAAPPDEFFDQTPFALVEFAENPEPRCPCVLLLDTSGSMQGQAIVELNLGLQAFERQLKQDPLAAKRVEVAVVGFGPVHVHQGFVSADQFVAPTLRAEGDTPMGAAILTALELVHQRKALYRENGIAYYRPWLFLITDGAPTDAVDAAREAIRAGEAAKSLVFYAVGVEGADSAALRQVAVRQPLRLKGLSFRELFVWLSNSLSSVSHSGIDDKVHLLNPAAPSGWATID
ncbi:MAG: VWA domain-containing protein [Bacteroidia bacterium]|nr:VWA domain-containing protein [Bacteroidia bacterium]